LSRDSSSTTSPRVGPSSTTSPTPRVRVPRYVAQAHHTARRRLLRLRSASSCFSTSRGLSLGLSRDSSSTTSPSTGSSLTILTTPRFFVPPHVTRLVMRLVVDYIDYAARPGASARRMAHLTARRRLIRLRRASGCLGTSCGSSHGSSRRSSSTTSTTPRIWVPRHITGLVTRLVALLITDYSASCRLVIDYFAYATRPGALAHRAARRAAHRRLLRIHRAFGCLSTSRGSSCRSSRRSLHLSSSSTSTMPAVTRLVTPCYSTRRAARHAARCAARHRLLRPCHVSGCRGTSRGLSRDSSRHSSSTASTTPGNWVPRHVARLVTRHVAPLVIDYSASCGLFVD
jgi:hypothetical protein